MSKLLTQNNGRESKRLLLNWGLYLARISSPSLDVQGASAAIREHHILALAGIPLKAATGWPSSIRQLSL